MANPTFDKVVTASARPRQFSLPAWLVLICIVTFSVLIFAGSASGYFPTAHPSSTFGNH